MDDRPTTPATADAGAPGDAVTLATRPTKQGETITAMAGTGGGTLSIRGDCLVTVSAGVVSLPVFREGAAEWNAEARTLRFANRTYRIGETVQWGGGSLPKAAARSSDFADRADRCGARDIFMVG